MKAIALRRGSSSVELIEVPKPTPAPDKLLIKIISCGICGTDREIIKRQIPDAPPGEDYLILGHEALGRVEETGSKAGNKFKPGDMVSVLVRRGCEKCNACRNGYFDYCYTGDYKERGIHKIHGFFSEYIVEQPQYLVAVPSELEDIAVLTEPMSISAKSMEVASQLMGRVCFDGVCSFADKQEKALVAGHGPIGILAAMLLTIKGFDVSVLGRRPKGDKQRELIESFGAHYLDITRNEDREYANKEGGFLLIIEAAGLSELTFRLPELLSRNGILILTGVPRGPQEICLDGNSFMANLVRFNQTVTGTVNASKNNFQQALEYLQAFKEQFPQAISKVITGRYFSENFQQVFQQKSRDEIKAVVEFS